MGGLNTPMSLLGLLATTKSTVEGTPWLALMDDERGNLDHVWAVHGVRWPSINWRFLTSTVASALPIGSALSLVYVVALHLLLLNHEILSFCFIGIVCIGSVPFVANPRANND